MAAPTETITALVLRRTKLGESDVIVTLLAEDGSQYKAVAKGARKPTSTFASRLELFSVTTILLAKGKNLDIIKEARLIEGHATIRSDYLLSCAAAPLVELLAKATFQEQPTPRLFDLSTATLSALERTEEEPLIITIAGLLKMLGFLGFRPTFRECVGCGAPIDLTQGLTRPFSYFDGGTICDACKYDHETTPLSTALLQWCDALLYSTLDEATRFQIPPATIRDAFVFIREWTRVHLGLDLRSIAFLFKNVLVSA